MSPRHSPKLAPCGLSADADRVLRVMADDGVRIQARRTFPHPHRYSLGTKTISPSIVAALDERRYVTIRPRDAQKDSIDYFISADGRRAAKGTVPKTESGQLDAFPPNGAA